MKKNQGNHINQKNQGSDNVPELRFPEFENEGDWNIEPLGNLSDEIVEKTKGRKYKLMSITSGVGLVSQIEKFGREIAGDSYKNYYVINNGDFAYNKSSTKLYGEGEIAMYEDEEIGAVPNSIFTCFRFHHNKIYPLFAKYPFINNLHGNWLKKFIAVGARANGALQVSVQDLFSLPFPYPTIQEQQKIASCISSLEEMITAHSQKLDLLKDHKKGLMQNLFPQPSELGFDRLKDDKINESENKKILKSSNPKNHNSDNVPKLRFKEFKGKWEEKTLGEVCQMQAGKFISASEIKETNSKDLFPVYGGNGLRGYSTSYNQSGMFSLIGRQGALCGNITLAQGDFYATEHALVVTPNGNIDTRWLFYILGYLNLNQYATGQAQPGLSVDNLLKVQLFIPPSKPEQQKIASCLSALDELITAQADKIEQLKQHKKGLMQGLFPKID